MPTAAKRKKANRAKVSAHRALMRAKGMRLLQIWVPDTRSPEFAKEARRQSRAVARSPQEKDDIAFVESLSSWLWRISKTRRSSGPLRARVTTRGSRVPSRLFRMTASAKSNPSLCARSPRIRCLLSYFV